MLLAIAVVALGACASGTAKQWYKPNGYTVADFTRDETACTKDGTVDEACLRSRGWISITADEDKGPTPVQPAGSGAPGSGTRRGGY